MPGGDHPGPPPLGTWLLSSPHKEQISKIAWRETLLKNKIIVWTGDTTEQKVTLLKNVKLSKGLSQWLLLGSGAMPVEKAEGVTVPFIIEAALSHFSSDEPGSLLSV